MWLWFCRGAGQHRTARQPRGRAGGSSLAYVPWASKGRNRQRACCTWARPTSRRGSAGPSSTTAGSRGTRGRRRESASRTSPQWTAASRARHGRPGVGRTSAWGIAHWAGRAVCTNAVGTRRARVGYGAGRCRFPAFPPPPGVPSCWRGLLGRPPASASGWMGRRHSWSERQDGFGRLGEGSGGWGPAEPSTSSQSINATRCNERATDQQLSDGRVGVNEWRGVCCVCVTEVSERTRNGNTVQQSERELRRGRKQWSSGGTRVEVPCRCGGGCS